MPKKIPTIKELRTAQKLSQAAFAKTIGVSTASVTAYETGRVNPSEKVLGKIKEVYNVDLALKPTKKVKVPKADTPAEAKTKAKRTSKAKAEKAHPRNRRKPKSLSSLHLVEPLHRKKSSPRSGLRIRFISV